MKTRKINKGKRYSNGCKNHGSCPYCKGSRIFSTKRRTPLVLDFEKLPTQV